MQKKYLNASSYRQHAIDNLLCGLKTFELLLTPEIKINRMSNTDRNISKHYNTICEQHLLCIYPSTTGDTICISLFNEYFWYVCQEVKNGTVTKGQSGFKIVIRGAFTITISSAKRQLVHMNTLGIGSMQHSRLTCYCRWQANALTSTVCVVTSVRWSWSRIQSLPAGTRCLKWAL